MAETKSPPTSNLVGIDSIKTKPIGGWEEFLHDGKAFLKTGKAAHAKARKAFTPEIQYNIIAMAIEKFVMAVLMRHGALPYNHTMGDLVESMEEVFPDSMGSLKEDLLTLDRYQEICDMDSFTIVTPKPDDIPWMLGIAEKLHELVSLKINGVDQ